MGGNYERVFEGIRMKLRYIGTYAHAYIPGIGNISKGDIVEVADKVLAESLIAKKEMEVVK